MVKLHASSTGGCRFDPSPGKRPHMLCCTAKKIFFNLKKWWNNPTLIQIKDAKKVEWGLASLSTSLSPLFYVILTSFCHNLVCREASIYSTSRLQQDKVIQTTRGVGHKEAVHILCETRTATRHQVSKWQDLIFMGRLGLWSLIDFTQTNRGVINKTELGHHRCIIYLYINRHWKPPSQS